MLEKMYSIADEEQMLALGASFAKTLQSNAVILLYGELGAGKTTFTRGLLRGLGYSEIVRSPTYALVETYQLAHRCVAHFDLYRLRDPEELDWIGFRDYFKGDTMVIIEWPERAGNLLPEQPTLCCEITTLPQQAGRYVKAVKNMHKLT